MLKRNHISRRGIIEKFIVQRTNRGNGNKMKIDASRKRMDMRGKKLEAFFPVFTENGERDRQTFRMPIKVNSRRYSFHASDRQCECEGSI